MVEIMFASIVLYNLLFSLIVYSMFIFISVLMMNSFVILNYVASQSLISSSLLCHLRSSCTSSLQSLSCFLLIIIFILVFCFFSESICLQIQNSLLFFFLLLISIMYTRAFFAVFVLDSDEDIFALIGPKMIVYCTFKSKKEK